MRGVHYCGCMIPSVIRDIRSVRHSVGYCPQFDAINDLLTGREHLTLYARLKGIEEKEIPQVSNLVSTRHTSAVFR